MGISINKIAAAGGAAMGRPVGNPTGQPAAFCNSLS